MPRSESFKKDELVRFKPTLNTVSNRFAALKMKLINGMNGNKHTLVHQKTKVPTVKSFEIE